MNILEKVDSQLLTNGITILIALFASIIALRQVKANIISSYRIKWIENLRELLSSYCLEIKNCGIIIQNSKSSCKGKREKEFDDEISKQYSVYLKSTLDLYKLGYKIELYLNSKEPSHKNVENLINKISLKLLTTNFINLNYDELENDLIEIIKISKTIFQEELKKSKSIFRI